MRRQTCQFYREMYGRGQPLAPCHTFFCKNWHDKSIYGGCFLFVWKIRKIVILRDIVKKVYEINIAVMTFNLANDVFCIRILSRICGIDACRWRMLNRKREVLANFRNLTCIIDWIQQVVAKHMIYTCTQKKTKVKLPYVSSKNVIFHGKLNTSTILQKFRGKWQNSWAECTISFNNVIHMWMSSPGMFGSRQRSMSEEVHCFYCERMVQKKFY